MGAQTRNQSILPTHLTIRSCTGPAPVLVQKPWFQASDIKLCAHVGAKLALELCAE
ncbi:hypothetical protein ART_1538 [Arthrobacter sp. PAMC 25486]|nr:hypothetical protein ART_1538 [Arthrobacter sp. PAMC 25486]